MKTFFTIVKKEITEGVRSGRVFLLLVVFVLFGIMNPAIAKLTPWLFDMLSETLSESGMVISEVTVTAKDSWVQFFKNISLALIIFVIINASRFSKEYASGTLVAIFTRGVARYKVVMAKAAVMLVSWTAGYFICFGITYLYNGIFWDNGIMEGLVPTMLNWYVFGVLTVCLLVLFSAVSSGSSLALLGSGGVLALSYALGMLPKLAKCVPTALMSTAEMMSADAEPNIVAIAIAVGMALLSLIGAVLVMNKKKL